MEKDYAYSEIFYSMQGEGEYTGVPTAWLRFFLCNLQCDGFGQEDPTDPSTYKLPYKDVIVTDYDRIEDLPVFEYGCDSSYSWSKKFRDLQYKGSVKQIGDRIVETLPKNTFSDNIHMCFTGGEPLMKHAQEASIGVMDYLISEGHKIPSVTYETNGTQTLTEEFKDFWGWTNNSTDDVELFFSVSPKLWTVAGEKAKKAIKPDAVAEYWQTSGRGQLKFVCNGTNECWDELESVVEQFREAGVEYPIWIMPVGATVEGQKGELAGAKFTDGDIANQALQRGYNVSARVHTYMWGNVIGV
jgi:6-pyruvoyltetrahydropterin 2'-reductase